MSMSARGARRCATRPNVLITGFFIAFGLLACDSGSRIDITPSGDSDCVVSMTSNSDGFTIEMTLSCSGDDHANCYEVTALTCQGDEKALEQPIAVETCPGDAYCIDSCVDGLEAPGHLWDIPGLLEVEGCNTYEDG